MKVQGFFSECREKEWQSKDGSKSGKSTFGVFVSGQDSFKWENYHDAAWCKEHGIHTGAAGEATIAFSVSDYGYQRVNLLGFRPLEQKETKDPEPEQPRRQEQKVNTPEEQAVADNMVQTAQNDPEAGEKLPF